MSKRKFNFNEKIERYVKIKLSNTELFCFCDDEDWAYLKEYTWRGYQDKNTWYAITNYRENGKRRTIHMHKMIAIRNGFKNIVNHIDHNGLNNVKSNLEDCTNKENSRYRLNSNNNKSGYKGVYWHKRESKWVAQIGVNGKRIFLGYYNDKIEAAEAYNRAATTFFGKFALLNELKGK